MRRGSNLPRVGDYNRVLVLDGIRRSDGGVSRVELSALTGLSAQTVSNICRRLMVDGLVVEAGKHSAGPGKPRTILRLAPEGRYALGVHLDPAVMTFVILDLVGNVVARSTRPTPMVPDPDRVVAQIGVDIEALITSSGVPRDRVLGLGIATPGPVDSGAGAVVDPPNLAGWRRVPLRDALQRLTGLPALLDKDVIAAAVAETWAGEGDGTGSFAFFYLGTGVGVGLVLRGEVHRGVSGNAGEIRHFVTDADGPGDACGMRGCLDVACMPQSVVQEAIALGLGTWKTEDAHSVDEAFNQVCRLAADGLPAAVALIDRSADTVAQSASDIANLLDIDRIVFGGPFWSRVEQRYLQVLPEAVNRRLVTAQIHPVEVCGTRVGAEVGAVGAACLVLDHTFSPRPTTLLLGA